MVGSFRKLSSYENTIGPLVEEKKEELKKDIEELERKKKGSRGYDRDVYKRKLKEKRAQVREEILDLKILDPAMGSGHFLVEATEKLANEIASLEEEFSPEEEDQSATVGRETEKTVKELKRQIVERSIYGVDKNPLATELAKLSLWLHTVAKGEPLSFLDHHLRTGDSLIGLEVEEMKTMLSEREQMAGLFTSNLVKDLGNAIGHLNLIEEITSESRDDVQEKKTEWLDVKEWIDKYKQAANVKLSASFGNEVDDQQYRQVLQAAANNNLKQVKNKSFFQRAQIIARDKSFFHWELEFPDVYRDSRGKSKDNPGFDVIIGNPPYDVLEKGEGWSKSEIHQLTNYFKNADRFSPALGGKINLFRLFFVNFFDFLKKGGKTGHILPFAIVADKSCRKLRAWIFSRNNLTSLDCFPQKDDPNNRVFPGAKLSTCIIEGERKEIEAAQFTIRVYSGRDITNDPITNIVKPEEVKKVDPKNLSIPLVDKQGWNIAVKLHERGSYLSPAFANVNRGEINQTTHKDFIMKDSSYIEMLKGAEIGRYLIRSEMSQGEKEWINKKKFLDHRKEDKFERITSERLGFQQVTGVDDTRRIVGTKIPNNTFLAETTNSVEPRESASMEKLLGILNSNLLDWRFRVTSSNNHVSTYEMEALPIILPDGREIGRKVAKILRNKQEQNQLNLNIRDYLGNYRDGFTLSELSKPAKNLSDTILLSTTEQYRNLRIGKAGFVSGEEEAILLVSARYKPESEESFDSKCIDQWGYTETGFIPAMRFSVDNKMKDLLKEFVPIAIEQSDGFANFRKEAGKTISPIERLRGLTLPKLEEVESGLEKYLEEKRRAEKLDREIKGLDHQIDAIVFDLYELEEDEVQTVLDSLETPEDEKRDILQKFKTVRG